MNDLNTFFDSRPAISKQMLCREAGISERLLRYIMQGQRPLTDRTAGKLYPVLNKYGGNFQK